MNAILSVIGNDRVGIIAAVCSRLAKFNVNVLEISQTIMNGKFTMIMSVDIGALNVSFSELKNSLDDLGKEMSLSINIQREEIFNAMHTI